MELQQKNKYVHWFIIGTFVTLYLLVSLISTIHVIDFFELSNASWLAITLAIAFEVGAAASLASLIVLDKMNKGIVWALFFTLTAMQAMGNTYYAFSHLENYQGWIELFGLNEEEPLYQKRVLSIVSGAILPLVALGFIKSLVDYIRPQQEAIEEKITEESKVDPKKSEFETKSEPEISKKTLVDLESFLAAMQLANEQKEKTSIASDSELTTKLEPELAAEAELITDTPTDINIEPEFFQVPVVNNIEELQPSQEKYASSYSEDDIEKKTI